MTTTTGTDLDARLAELIARFEANSDSKGGRARIRYSPPRMAWGPPEGSRRRWPYAPIVLALRPQRWSIVYLYKTSDDVMQFGICIGRTKAAAIHWLIEHDRAWNR